MQRESRMTHRCYPAAVALGVSVIVAACEQPTTPTAPEPVRRNVEAAPALEPLAHRGIESEYVALEERLPGFGGIYFNESGDLVAKVADPAQESAREEVRMAFLEDGRFVHPDGRVPNVLLERADYAMSTLIEWTSALRSSARVEHGIHVYDADEKRNRVTIKVTDDSRVESVYQLAEALGIPRDAVVVGAEPMSRALQYVSVQADSRPYTRGGFQFRAPGIFSTPDCSLGYNVSIPGSQTSFITAAHCIPDGGAFQGWTGAVFLQNASSGSDHRGPITHNPAFFSTGCAAGVQYCTYADAAIGQYTNGLGIIRVVQTLGYGEGNNPAPTLLTHASMTGSTSYPVVARDMEGLPVGWNVFKTGRKTGTTHGPTTMTCGFIIVSAWGTSFELWCAGQGQLWSEEGDSGGPVFRWYSHTQRSAVGIVSSGGYGDDGLWRVTWSNWGMIVARFGFEVFPY